MHSIETSVEVNAPAARLWQAVADVEQWPKWTASMREISWLTGGGLTRGRRARIRQSGTPALVWDVSDVEPGSSFTWRTASAVVTAIAFQRIRALGPDKAELTVGVAQSGPMAGLIGLLSGRRTRRYIKLEADGLKRCAENPDQ
ncbi:MAG: SRPBCC family protein [Streptosporangiaceae bacterium]